MAAPHLAPLTPVKVPGTTPSKGSPYPTDAMQAGVHSALGSSSAHKKQISGVLHLKRESIGRTGHPSSYSKGKKFAFKGAK